MGMQNAVATSLSDARVRATHVSGIATDLGIELALLFDVARGREPQASGATAGAKLRLHLETISSFIVGGVVGVATYAEIGLRAGLFGAAFALLFMALNGLWQAGRPVRGNRVV